MFVLASNHFRKCFSLNAGVWLRMENKFFWNYFQLTECFKGFDSEMVWSENFHFKPFPDSRAKREKERERERESLRLRLRRSQPLTSTLLIYEPTNLRTHRSRLWLRRSTNPRTDLRPRAFDPWTFDFAGDLEPSHNEPIFDPEPWTHEPISLSVWFWSTHEPLISDFFVVVVVVWVVVF